MSINLLAVLLIAAQVEPSRLAPTEPATLRANREVEVAAREFRRSVYENFRTDREAFDYRWSLGEDLLGHWTALQKPAESREAVRAWFVEAERLSSTASSVGLPPLPELPELTLPTTRQDPNEGDATPSITPPEVIAPPLPMPSLESFPGAGEDPTIAPSPTNETLPSAPKENSDAAGPANPVQTLLEFSESLFGGGQPTP